MKIGTTGFVGERLTEAREARGITATSLAELLGLTSATISQYEHGKQTPRPEIMEAISERLNLPVSFFLRSVNEHDDQIFFRSLSATTKGSRIKASRRFQWLKEISGYIETFLDLPELNLPVFNVPSDPAKITPREIEEIAMACRDHLQLGDGPIADLILVLENNGVIVSRGMLEEETINAFSQRGGEGRPYVFLTADKNSAVRSRLDAAHELGHLILHRNFAGRLTNNPIHKLLEDQAFYFASAFFLPEKAFSSALWAPTLDAFHSLKSRWRVSIGMMIKRCEELGITNEQQTRRLWINYNRRQWRKREPLDDRIEPEEPCLLRTSFEMIVERQIKSREQIMLDLCLAPTDIEQLANLPRGFMTGKGPEVMVMPKTKVATESMKTGSGMLIQFAANREID